MTTKVQKNFEVIALDASSAEVIKKATTEVQAEPDGSKYFSLNFNSTTGDIPSGISHLLEMYNSDVEFITNASGELPLGPILPLAGGKFGERNASSTATFKLFDDTVKAGKKRKALTAGEKNALEILDKLSGGKKARIKAVMLSGAIITATEMKSLGLIDDVKGGFADKYAQARLDAKNKK